MVNTALVAYSKQLCHIAVASGVTLVVQSLTGAINTMWVSRLCGAHALAAVANVNIVMLLMTSFSYGIAGAAAILTGQAIGRNSEGSLSSVVNAALTLSALLNITLCLICWSAGRYILLVLNTPLSSRDIAEAYLRVSALGLPMAGINMLLISIMRTSGGSYRATIIAIAASVTDLVLNPLLIAGFGHWTGAGPVGAAYATLGSAVSALLTIIILNPQVSKALIRRESSKHRPLVRREDLAFVASKGSAIGLQGVVQAGSAMAMLGLINSRGYVSTASYAINNQIWSLMQIPTISFATASSILLSISLGRRDYDEVRDGLRLAAVFNVLAATFIVTGFAAFGGSIVRFLVDGRADMYATAQHINHIVTSGFVFFSITSVISGAMRAGGVVFGPLIISLLTSVPLRLAIAYFGPQYIGEDAVWYSYPISSAVALIATYAVFRRVRWQNALL